MEHFAQTNVFSQIRTVFARIRTVFAHLIIGCAIQYPKIGCLRYPTVQNVTDNTIKHKRTLYNSPVFISSEYWKHIFICINWNTILRVT